MWQLNGRSKRIFYFCCSVLLCSFIVLGNPSLLRSQNPPNPPLEIVGTVEPITPEYQPGHQLYLEKCGSCHIALPPAVLSTQSWVKILANPQHYSTQIEPLPRPTKFLVTNYLRQYSRSAIGQELIATRLRDSRYFKALHPQVEFTQPIATGSCVSCHTNAAQFDFRTGLYNSSP